MENIAPLYKITFIDNKNNLNVTYKRNYDIVSLINTFLNVNIGKIGCILSIERVAKNV
jgi:hypothetical protein